MMGTKTRSFSPLPRDVSLEELVPEGHFYRRLEALEARLDLSFVRDLVRPLYARGGRPGSKHEGVSRDLRILLRDPVSQLLRMRC